MSDVAVIQKATLYEMADAIIDTTGRTEDFKVRDFPNLIRNEVYGAGYDKGYEEGVENAKPVLYGTYLLKEHPDYSGEYSFHWGFGEYSFFYITQNVQYVINNRIELYAIGFDEDGIIIDSNPNNEFHLQYKVAKGYWELVQTVDDAGVTAEPFPNESCRILEFTEPFEVSKEFYDLFMSIVDNADGTAYGIGHTEGKKAERDQFWDVFQEMGNRRAYLFAFRGFDDTNFYPKYDIICTGSANLMFSSSKISNLKDRLKECGVTLDTSGATSMNELFAYNQYLTRVPTISTVSSSNTFYLFCNCWRLIEIEKLILKSDGSQSMELTFGACDSLETLTIEGTIGKGDADLHWSTKLSKNSIYSVITHLSTTTSGLSITLSLEAVNKAFETGLNYKDGATSEEFMALRRAYTNWTINLV